MTNFSALTLASILATIAACSAPPLDEGRYNLAASLVTSSCLPPDVPLENGLVLDIIETTDQYWGGVELNHDANLEGWFEGGGALGQGQSYLAVDGHAHADWTIELYPEDDDFVSGRVDIQVTAETVATWEDCFMSLDLSGARM